MRYLLGSVKHGVPGAQAQNEGLVQLAPKGPSPSQVSSCHSPNATPGAAAIDAATGAATGAAAHVDKLGKPPDTARGSSWRSAGPLIP
jgi:hypothetical protein